jgi:hypothetical protein
LNCKQKKALSVIAAKEQRRGKPDIKNFIEDLVEEYIKKKRRFSGIIYKK